MFVLQFIFTRRKNINGTYPVAHIVAKCVDREPDGRYQSVREVIADEETIDAPVPIIDSPSGRSSDRVPAAAASVFSLVDRATAGETPA